jgi:hypothetical protein
MATNIKGPAIFLAQFAGDAAPYNSFDSITKWAASLLGGRADSNLTAFDLKNGGIQNPCDEVKAWPRQRVEITEPQRICRASLWRSIRPYDEALTPRAGGSWQAKERQKWASSN